VESIPSRVVTFFRLPGASAGAGFREVFRPFDDVIQASPVLRWSVHLHRGSALRLSQPLSGFLARLDFAAFFHAAAIRGVHPTER
jgi:hypothetical protein